MKSEIWWAIKHPDGKMLFAWTASWWRSKSIKLMQEHYRESWKALYRRGFRAVKIEVKENWR